jgi:CHAD domain-containing protein
MMRHLDSPAYQRLVTTSERMLESLGTATPWMPRERAVGRVAPRFLHVAWRTLRGYAPVLRDAPIELLHAMRIDSKRLRYGLEFVQDVLPPRIVALIPEVTALQDYLGEMHDAAVAVEMIDAFLGGRRRGPRYAGVRAYREACYRETVERLAGFGKVWERFDGTEAERQFERLKKL